MMSATSPESCEAFSPAFSKSAEIYDLIHAGKDYDGEAKRVLELLGPVPVMPFPNLCNLIDWGCGTGEFTRRFSAAGWAARGVDWSPEMVRLAGRKGIDACRASMNTPGIAGTSQWEAQTCLFAAFSYASASHPPLLILENFRRAAAKGGKLVFDFVNADAELHESQSRNVSYERDAHSDICGTVKRRGCICCCQKKRLVDMRLIEDRVQYSRSEIGDSISDVWVEMHYLRTYFAREMAELISRAGWKLEKFIDLESQLPPESMSRYVASGDPYYLTAVCTAI